MTVNLSADTDADSVYLAPNGSGSAAPTVSWKDNTTANLGLIGRSEGQFGGTTFSTLPEGNYTVGVRRGNETLDTRGVTLTANPTVTALQPETWPENDRFQSTGNLTFTLTNTGNLPTFLNAVGMTGVPGVRRIRGKPASEVPPASERVTRVSQSDVSDELKMVVAPSDKSTFKTKWGPLQLIVENYQKYTRDLDDDKYPELPTPCRTKQWPATLVLQFAHTMLTRSFTYSFSGEAKEPSFSNKYLCGGVSTSIASGSSGGTTTENRSTSQ